MAGAPAPTWATEQVALRREIAKWVAACLKSHPHVPYSGGHDEGSFAGCWDGHYLLSGDDEALALMAQLKSQAARWFEKKLVHGYWPEQEAHHGPEMFCYFLARLRGLLPDDEELRQLFVDAAHHVGNWVEGIPAWYDWEAHRFRSWKLGTREVVSRPPFDVNVPDHLKFLHLTLPAFLLTGEERYLELSRDYAGARAEALLAGGETLPVIDFPAEAKLEQYNSKAVGMMWGHAKRRETLPGQLEPHVAAGAIDVMLDLFRLTREERFAAAARRVAEPLVAFVGEPESDPPGSQLLSYRRVTGDTSLDDALVEQVSLENEADLDCLAMIVTVDNDPQLTGIGKRNDMLRWGYERRGAVRPERGPSPTALLLAYEVTGDAAFADRAFAKARARVQRGRPALPDGRNHGCGGASMSALLRGHGRNGDVGMATGVLYPGAFGSARFCGSLGQQHAFRSTEGEPGLPSGVAVLSRDSETHLCNVSGDRASMTFVRLDPITGQVTDESSLDLDPGAVIQVA